MAAIVERQLKSGISYLIQVKIKDTGSGKTIVKSMSWKKPKDLTKKQADREVVVIADKFESDIKKIAYGIGEKNNILNVTLKEYSEKWLERTKNEKSISYFVNTKACLEKVYEYIGGYKLKDLSPTIIQNFYDKLDTLEKTVYNIKALPQLRKVMDSRKIRYKELRYDYGVNACTLANALAGKQITMESAKNIANILKVNITEIFSVEEIKQKYAYETIHKVKRTLRTILSSAKRQRIITDNYASADFITFPKRPTRVIDCMKEEESHVFYKSILHYPDIRYKTAMMILLMTGFRRGELCGLEWKDIDFIEKTITVARSLTAIKGYGVYLKEPKTESSKRTISINDTLINQLKEYKTWQDEYKNKLGDRWEETDRLFTLEFGGRINPSVITKWLDKVLKYGGLEHRTVHSIRHTNITMQIISGVPLVTVAGRAGHARTSTTADIYSHFTRQSDRKAADALENMFNTNSPSL